jgi:hypothetical protein
MYGRSMVFIVRVLVAVVIGLQYFPVAAANLTIPTAGRVTIELITSDATFRNTLSVISPGIAIPPVRGCQLEPSVGLTGLPVLSEKASQHGCRVDLDADPAAAGIQAFAAGTAFEFGMCAQTDPDPDCEFVWSSNPGNNSDSFDHVQTTTLSPGVFQLAWEDLPGGGDMDFNDLIVVVRVQADADGDGLWDDWEQSGIDTDGDGTRDFDLPALGANPQRKDIFLEIDYMDCATAGGSCPAGDTHSHQPKMAAVNAVISAFNSIPLANPDGTTGITLHVEIGNAIAHQNFLALGCGLGTSFDPVKANPVNFGPDNPRRFTHHYVIFAHRQAVSTTSSGCAELPGNDILVTLGDWNTICIGPGANNALNTAPAGDDVTGDNLIFTGPNLTCNTTVAGDDVQFIASGSSPASDLDGDTLDDRTVGTIQQQAGTLMHEFGHNLSLQHGGSDSVNRKPNYLSIMNYAFQIPGIPPTDPDGAGPLRARVDFSHTDLADLNENSLNETIGIGDGGDNTLFFCPNGTQRTGPGTGPIDWDCDSDGATETSVSVDVNGDGTLGVLSGWDDWNNLRYTFQNTTDFVDGVHETTVDILEIDYPTHLQIPQIVQINIKPGNDLDDDDDDDEESANRISCRQQNKLIPVAILTTPDFDALSVDHTTVSFEGASEFHVAKNGDPRRHERDVDRDGDLDLVFHFRLRDTSLTCDSTQGTLIGATLDGRAILGTDSVQMTQSKDK